mmetsp:Transcript_24680/g.38396  ORF Transcript_24680/g.38396 Transcript_24680/m.38396 type:complete len:124 (-) Transcript_24680:26-397(-)
MDALGQDNANVDSIRGSVLEIFPSLNYETLYNTQFIPSQGFINTIPEVYAGQQASLEKKYEATAESPEDIPTVDLNKIFEGVTYDQFVWDMLTTALTANEDLSSDLDAIQESFVSMLMDVDNY